MGKKSKSKPKVRDLTPEPPKKTPRAQFVSSHKVVVPKPSPR